VFEAIAAQDDAATEAGVTLLPGVGFDVVPTDCLAAYVHQQRPDAQTLDVAFMGLGRVSRGTLRTAVEQMGAGGVVRRNGQLQSVPPGWTTRRVDFGADGPGERTVISIPWGDIATAYRSTQIPNITTYTYLPQTPRTLLRLSRYIQWLLRLPVVRTLLERWVDQQPPGPSADEREQGRTFVWASARNAQGDEATARLQGPEGYTFTAHAAVAAAQHVRSGNASPGYQTPASALGADFALTIDGVSREDVEDV
jgi:saccharopine dehydrogenase (NAD+, L-lysine-forming)